jgi:hypothetical protein
MNHQKAREKAQKKGLPAPTSFDGAAGEAFKCPEQNLTLQ